MTTSTSPATDDEFTEKRTWRDTLASLRDRLTGGEDVDQDELTTALTHATAEEEIESARRTRHDRKRLKASQDAARQAITDALADLDPDAGPAARARIEAAYEVFLDVVATEVDAAEDHKRRLEEAVRPYSDTGLAHLQEDYAPRRGWPENVDRDHYVQASPGHPTSWIMWRGVRYSVYAPDLKRWSGIGTWKSDLSKARERAKN